MREDAPGAEALLQLCAFLASDDIPRSLPREQAALLPEELGHLVRDPLAYNNALGTLARYSLATVTPTALGLHRLVQAVIRARLKDREGQWAQIALELLEAAFPKDSWELARWRTCQRLLPHVIAATGHAERLEMAGQQEGRLLDRTSTYLLERGRYSDSKPLAERALAVTEQVLGPEHAEVCKRHDTLGRVLQELGDYQGAKQHYQQALEIGQATLGPDHPFVAVYRRNLDDVVQQTGGVWRRALQQLPLSRTGVVRGR